MPRHRLSGGCGPASVTPRWVHPALRRCQGRSWLAECLYGKKASSDELAGSSAFGVGRYLRDTSSLDPGGWENPSRPCADGQSLVAGSAVRDQSWADHIADPLCGRSFQIDFDFIDHVLRCKPARAQIETIALGPRSVADFYAEMMGRLRGLGLETRIWTMPVEIPDAIPFEHDRRTPPTTRNTSPVLAHPGPGGSRLHPVPRAVSWQGQPGAFLLGQLRSGGHALLRAPRAPAGGRLAELGRLGHAGGLLA